jgi:uncharacterized protein DUF6868
MDIQTVTQFFMWCSVINGGLLLYVGLVMLLFPNFIYTMHSRFFPLPRETFNAIIYSFLALYKIIFFTFCLVPYLALRIVG